METIEISKETVDFIKEYAGQDNLGNQHPIYFTICDIEWQASYHKGEGDRHILIWDTEVALEASTMKSLTEKICKDKTIGFPEGMSRDPEEFDFEEWNEFNGGHGSICSQVSSIVEKGAFLLMSDSKRHLKENKHRYSDSAYVACKHLFRVPRQAAFLNDLKGAVSEDD